MNAEDNQDFTTLSWVKRDLDETFGRAREALEAYVDDPEDKDLMQECAALLHQAHGTLRMVEMYGAAMVLDEMELLAAAVSADKVEDTDEAYAVLMRGLVQTPDYLERIQGGHRDIPVVLLPLLNDLRAARGAREVSEAVLFAPNLGAELPESAPGAGVPLPQDSQRQQVQALRTQFQVPLLAWMRQPDDTAKLAGMREVLDQIGGLCHSVTGRRLWWIAGGVLEGLEQHALDTQRGDLRPLLGRVDRAIKQLIDGGEMALAKGDAEDLARQMLYHVAQAGGDSPRLKALRKTYNLDDAVPDEQEIEAAQGAMSGHNRALLDTVSGAIKEDLLKVKDALDIFLRKGDPDVSELAPQVDVLDRVSDTLGMLGLPVPSRVIDEQHQTVQSMVEGSHPHDESTLLDVAGALLYVESSLDDHIQNLGHRPATEDDSADEPLGAEARQVHDSLMAEAQANLAKVKQDIVAFVETPWDHREVQQIPQLLDEIGGAMRILEVDRPADLLEGIGRYVHNELIVDHKVPTAEQMEKVADALASFEYYLEAAREHRVGRDQILDVTQQSLGSIGYWPVPEKREPVQPEPQGQEDTATEPAIDSPEVGEIGAAAEAAVTELPDSQESSGKLDQDEDQDWVWVEEEIEEQVPADDGGMEGGFQAVSDEIDEDIREVFVEEFEEEIEGLDAKVESWKTDPGNLGELKEIRRTFHTLKGSGRLVGALGVGEFSWKVENMLNRVLDDSIEPNAEVVALVDHAVAALPFLLARLKGEETTSVAPVAAIMTTADQLAEGESARVEDHQTGTRTVTRTVRRRVPRSSVEPPLVDQARDQAAEPVQVTDESQQPEVELPAEPAVDLPAAQDDDSEALQDILASEDQQAAAASASALPEVDPVLLGILRSEVEQHVGVMQSFCETHGAVAEPVRVPESLLRSVHTLSGAVAMVDIPVLVQVLAPLENFLKRSRAHQEGLTAEGLGVLSDSAVVINQVMAQFDNDSPVLPDTEALVERVSRLRDSLPEPPMAHPLFVEDEAVNEDAAAEPVAAEPEQPADAAPDEPEMPSAASTEPDLQSVDIPTVGGENLFAQSNADDASEAEGESLDDLSADWLRQEIEGAAADLPDAADSATAEDAEQESAATDDLAADLDDESATAGSADLPVFSSDVENESAGIASFLDEDSEGRDSSTDEPEAPVSADPDLVSADFEALDQPEAGDELSATQEGQAQDEEPDDSALPDVAEDQIDNYAELTEPEPAEGTEPRTQAPQEPSESELQVEASSQPGPEPLAEDVSEPAPPAEESEDVEQQPDATAIAAAAVASIQFPDDPQPDANLDIPDMDADLLEVFVEESGEILDDAEETVAALRDNPQDVEPVVSLQRGLHTLKGGARMAGLAPIGDLGHAMESLLQAAADGKYEVNAHTVSALEHGFDRLHGLIQRVRNGQAVAMPDNAIGFFEAMLAGEQPVTDPAEPARAEPISEAAPQAETAVADVPAPSTPRTAEDDTQATAAFEARTSQEVVRVRSDLLDSLVNAAGEVSIYRARLEEQTASFRFNLVEFEQTTDRLREQLRKMEIETEAQIIARYQREQEEAGDTDGVFDPLELDRFSQLQQYSRSLGESVSDLVSIQGLLDDLIRQSETLLLQQSRVSSELQEGLMRTRMIPFDSLVPSLRRTLRQAAQETGKHARLRITGAQGEMDRNLLERIKAPFEHMLRNAMAHGIESPAERQRLGKPAEGTVGIDVQRDATEVVIEVSDDGCGINMEAVRAKAVERGLMKDDVDLPRRDIYAFMLETGFSTAREVTKLAGRGVGLDVVASEIKQLGGSLSIDSEPGTGTTFTIRLPFTLAVTQAILVGLGEHTFAVPMTSVEGVARIDGDDLRQRLDDADSEYIYAGESYRLYDLSSLLDMPLAKQPEGAQVPMLMTRTGDQRAAVRIDRVVGSREIVVKPVGPQISSVPGIFGATIMGDGSVVMILDLAPLVRRHLALRADIEEGTVEEPASSEVEQAQRLRPLVMVVDDSITMRKVTTRTLERNDLDSITAKDGLDAVEKLQEHIPDLMLLDIEMPRMDGYELATYMRNDERLRNVPIIMVTSRTGEKHRQRALELGVKRYLGKPYQEADLLSNVKEALADRV